MFPMVAFQRIDTLDCIADFKSAVENPGMKTYIAVVERDSDTGYLVGYVPGFPGAHSHAESLKELKANLTEVISMLMEDGIFSTVATRRIAMLFNFRGLKPHGYQ